MNPESGDHFQVRGSSIGGKAGTGFPWLHDAQVTAKASDPIRKMDPFFGPML
jgi:hypothetical protein